MGGNLVLLLLFSWLVRLGWTASHADFTFLGLPWRPLWSPLTCFGWQEFQVLSLLSCGITLRLTVQDADPLLLLLLFSIVSTVALESLVEAVLDSFQSWLEAFTFAPADLLAEVWVWSSSSSFLAVPHPPSFGL